MSPAENATGPPKRSAPGLVVAGAARNLQLTGQPYGFPRSEERADV